MQTVVETPGYLAVAEKIFNDAERLAIVAGVAADPECGDLMQGTGGFRKMRARRGSRGKSGGARVIYIYRDESFPVFLITVFTKNEKANLTHRERNELKKRADAIFNNYRK